MSLTKKQEEYLMQCNHRWNVKYGATGSGKSYVDFAAVIPKRILACKDEGLRVLLGNTSGTLERNILEPMRQIWSDDLVGYIKQGSNTVNLFGKKCYALGADNIKQVSKIQGASFEYVYGDEVTTWSQEVFEMLKSRLRCKHSVFDGTCNPAGPQHWFKKFLDSDADIYKQKYIIDDGRLPEEVVRELKKEYAGKVYYGRFILGEWVSAEGIIYDVFNPLEHVLDKEPKTEGEYYVSSDFGIQNATVFLLWGKEVDSDRWICLSEYRYSGRETNRQKTVSGLVDDFEKWLNGVFVERVIVDPSASALITELRQRGYRVKKANNDVSNGIHDVSTALENGLIAFMKSCKGCIDEFGMYSWDSKKADIGIDAPIKENDHSMDAVRYFVKTMKLVKERFNEEIYGNYIPIY